MFLVAGNTNPFFRQAAFIIVIEEFESQSICDISVIGDHILYRIVVVR